MDIVSLHLNSDVLITQHRETLARYTQVTTEILLYIHWENFK